MVPTIHWTTMVQRYIGEVQRYIGEVTFVKVYHDALVE